MEKHKLLNYLYAVIRAQENRGAHPDFIEGIRHVAKLVGETFQDHTPDEELLEFCVSIICSIAPEDWKLNRELTQLELGTLSVAYGLHTVAHPNTVKLPL